MKIKNSQKRIDEMAVSDFNSSDMEAYREEQPIPILQQAFNQYQRNKKKARMRRSSSFTVSPNPEKVDLILKEKNESTYDDPNKRLVYAHE